MRFDLDTMEARERYKLLTGTVVPRPIGWIATVDEDGRRNVAPFSYFQIASASPPVLLFSGGSRSGQAKDSVQNALATGGFVAHIADTTLLEAVNLTSVEAPHEIDEFAYADLDAEDSELVAAPRVTGAPVAFECELLHHWPVPDGGNTVVFGRVRLAHVRDDLVLEDGRIDVRALDPIARLAGTLYGTLGQVIEMARPTWQAPPSD
jgi:flavin reductase (DIM6/NTAB) family NADH-FMN oxidoreductase RutF